jgi:hypothetical protein
MRLKDFIEVKSNVFIVARERGKIIQRREGHNIWVNNGRQYLAEVISPLNNSFNAHYNDAPVRVVEYMGFGIGGERQVADLATPAPQYTTLVAHYPGLNTFDDTVLTIPYLERPVKVSGTAGVGASAGVWMGQIVAPPTFISSGIPPVTNTVEMVCLFGNNDLHLAGAYPSVPLAEVGLFLSSQTASRQSNEVYDYADPPEYINEATRPQLIAYHTFDTISKTPSVTMEIHWQLQF